MTPRRLADYPQAVSPIGLVHASKGRMTEKAERKLMREITWRVRRWRVKRWLSSREFRVTLLALAALLVLLSHVFAGQAPGSAASPFSHRDALTFRSASEAGRFGPAVPDAVTDPGWREISPGAFAFVRSRLFLAFVFLLVVAALAIVGRGIYELLEDERDEGRVMPEKQW